MSKRLTDGYPAKVTMADFPGFDGVSGGFFYIKDVTIPALSGGGPLDLTWMGTNTFRRSAPKKLKALGPMTLIGAYKTDIFDPTTGLAAIVNHNQLFTIVYADGAEQDLWMYVNDGTFSQFSERETDEPSATLVVVFTGLDNNFAEVDPVYRAAP